MINVEKLRSLYRQYGFKEEESYDKAILVFSLMAGHYHNVDIIPIEDNANSDAVFEQYKSSGYACKVRNYENTQQVEDDLFKGFFSSDATHSKFEKEYVSFTNSVAKLYSETGSYQYIKSGYQINDKEGELSAVDEVVSRLTDEEPILFLIEAAAGFGKTCTAYEILNDIISTKKKYVPLFTELSRNRQAKIFRYVLLDEIDRSFPTLSSQVVNAEIRNGNVPVILDGFDELLHESNVDREYENTEPMLETIGELLVKKAKIILTTRRTAIFDGDEFHQWMEDHGKDFQVVRIRIFEPTITDWLSDERIEGLKTSGLNVYQLSNPVLLSFLRSIDEQSFSSITTQPELIVNKYFDSMMERERTRQDLRMDVEEQYKVLLSIARDMIQSNYTGETREYLVTVIQEYNQKLLEKIRSAYAVDERPTTDEIANKLASHALLDRNSDESQGIGFVNDFVLGNFSADVIMEHSQKEWVGDKRFMEPAIISYAPRTIQQRKSLWESLKFAMEFASGHDKIVNCIKLNDCLDISILDETVEGAKIQSVIIGEFCEVRNTIFIDCMFIDVEFKFENISSITFINCDFFNCKGTGDANLDSIYIRGCNTDNSFLLQEINHEKAETKNSKEQDSFPDAELFVLERFWPKGRPTFIKHKAIKALLHRSNDFSYEDLLQSITSLKSKELLLVPSKKSFLEINVEKIPTIKAALRRD